VKSQQDSRIIKMISAGNFVKGSILGQIEGGMVGWLQGEKKGRIVRTK
jgi:uncharacterized protein YcfJ